MSSSPAPVPAPTCDHYSNESVTGGDDDRGSTVEEQMVLAKTEDRAVSYLRLLVALLLAMVTLAVSLSVYFVTHSNERQDFEDDFVATSAQVVETFGATLNLRFKILDSVALDMTSRVQNNPDMEWPFVTFPDYGVRAGKIARIGTFLDITLLPIVEEAQLQQWNNYSMNNDQWIPESLAILEGVPVEEIEYPPVGPVSYFENGEFPIISNASDMPGPYAPQWLAFPATRVPSVNVDSSYGTFATSVATVRTTGKPVLAQSVDTFDLPGSPRTTFVAALVEKSQDGITFQNDPLAPIYYPVFDTVFGEGTKTVTAVLRAGIYWRSYFQGLLPASSEGIVVVLENSCNNVYTYQIDGSKARCLGRGDLHDTKYDYLEANATVGSLLGLESGQAVPGECLYELRVYPSQELEDNYMTSKPMIFALLLATVFILTSATFLLYDYCVRRRQRIVVKSAEQSSKIVQSLFPQTVRDRLFEEQEAKENANCVGATEMWTDTNSNLSFGGTKASAIANLYPDCTVLFADIAGFTKWSSSRLPSEVFELLESIYAIFDVIAKKRRVFKIETIGDCYVAATGLPYPQKDHAVIMAKFANDCIKKLHELLNSDLMNRLGEDTRALAVRIGLHSGPVTAGVLRGEKARFQIFGDTVNTAARMESTGLREKIQVSQTTADLIVQAGGGDWLVKRDELVSAKGKGDMQTYFVNIGSARKVIAPISTGCSDDVEKVSR